MTVLGNIYLTVATFGILAGLFLFIISLIYLRWSLNVYKANKWVFIVCVTHLFLLYITFHLINPICYDVFGTGVFESEFLWMTVLLVYCMIIGTIQWVIFRLKFIYRFNKLESKLE